MSESTDRRRRRTRPAESLTDPTPQIREGTPETAEEFRRRRGERTEARREAPREPLKYMPPPEPKPVTRSPMGVPQPGRMPQQPQTPPGNRPEGIQRHQPAPGGEKAYDINRRLEPAPHKVPLWMVILSVLMLLTVSGLFAAKMFQQGWLAQKQREKEAAYQAILQAYPVSYRDLIEQYAEENNLQPAFVTAIILNESSFSPMAVSNVGARGLMQLMPETASWIAGKLKVSGYHFDMMYDPETNIRFGCWYLGYLSRLFQGNPASVAAAYHAGQGQVTAWLSNNRLSQDGVTLDIDAMEDGPTKTYAKRVTKAYGIYQVLYFEESDDVSPDSGSGALPSV